MSTNLDVVSQLPGKFSTDARPFMATCSRRLSILLDGIEKKKKICSDNVHNILHYLFIKFIKTNFRNFQVIFNKKFQIRF